MAEQAKENNGIMEYAIVKEVMRIFKLDDAGRVTKFFKAIEKSSNRKIEHARTNIEVIKINRKNTKEDYAIKLEDAKDDIMNARTNVDIERLGSNANIEVYMSEYLATIATLEAKYISLKTNATNADDAFDVAIKDEQKYIKSLQKTIDFNKELK